MNDTKTETKKATMLKDVLIDAHVEADLSGMIMSSYQYRNNPLLLAKDLERACKDFHNFLRDHRSQDMVQLSVIREHKDLCSVCHNEWEVDDFESKKSCAHCGAEIEDVNLK